MTDGRRAEGGAESRPGGAFVFSDLRDPDAPTSRPVGIRPAHPRGTSPPPTPGPLGSALDLESTERTPVSTRGGRNPIWARDGSAIYFQAPDLRLMVAWVVATDPEFDVAQPEQLFELPAGLGIMDIGPDGLFFARSRGSAGSDEFGDAAAGWRINVVLNLLDELTARVPAGSR